MSDSHTNFDPSAFTVGAVGASVTLAGALVAGVVNVLAARREFNADQWQRAFELSEALRADANRKLREKDRRIAALELSATRRAVAPVVNAARAVLRSRSR